MTMKVNVKSKRKIILKSIILLMVLYIVFLFVSLFVKIRTKEQEIKDINEQISAEKNKTQEILDKLEGKNGSSESGEQSEESSQASGVRVYENVVR